MIRSWWPAILADTGLAERQKQALIDIYEAFRRENAQLTSERADTSTPAEQASSENSPK